MSDRLPPEVLAELAALEGHDRVTLNTQRARVVMHREGGRITMSLTSIEPEAAHPPVTMSGDYPTYVAAFLAFSEYINAALEHAMAGLPRH